MTTTYPTRYYLATSLDADNLRDGDMTIERTTDGHILLDADVALTPDQARRVAIELLLQAKAVDGQP
jgi:hypothetical protein